MATVYLAEHPRISKRVAVKVIHHDLAASPEMVSRFLAEARAASQINHEHVVDILDFGQTDTGENFMIMEYLDGQTLSARVRAATRLDTAVALSIGQQIAEALIAAHNLGVIHRDLKPDNIFLIRRPNIPDYVKILDFGLAKLLTGAEGLQHRTSSGSVLGTPHYMAPEQCEGRVTVDGRADLYSLGCILFHMVTGGLPFGGDGFAEVILKHLSEPPPSPRRQNPQVSPGFDKVILHCLAKNRDFRFQSAAELLEALRDPERWSAEFGEDPMRLLGPAPGRRAPQAPPTATPQMATMMGTTSSPGGAAASAALTNVAQSTSGVAALPPLASGTNIATPRPTPVIRAPGGESARTQIGSSIPSPTEAPPVAASVSQLAAMPVVANRAAPQMATMIGEMPAAAISALASLAPPPVSSPVASASGLRPVEAPTIAPSQSQVSGWGGGGIAPPPPAPPPPWASGAIGMPGQQYTPPSYPPPPAGPPAMGGYSSPSYPPAASGSAPPVYAPPSYPPSGLPASAATPQSASSSAAGGKPGPLVPLLGRFAKQKWVQDFLTLPPARRLRVLRVSAAAFGCAVLLLLLLLLWPHRVPIIVRSNPDQAEVFRNGESLGKTPLVIEIQKGAEEKLVLRKSGYEETTQEIKGGGEKVVLVTLEETGSGKPAGSPTDKPQVPQKPPTTANPPTEPSPPVKPPATGTSPSTAEKPHPQAPQEAAEEGGDNSGDTGAKSDSGDETKKKKKKKKKKVVVF